MANAVIRQLGFENLDFEVVLTGSMFDGGAVLIDPMVQTIHKVAPKARLVRLAVPPVIGAVILGMEVSAMNLTLEIRKIMKESVSTLRNTSVRQT